MTTGVMKWLKDLNTVLGQTNVHRFLMTAAKNIKIWFVNHTLNAFNQDMSQKCLIAEYCIPRLDIDVI